MLQNFTSLQNISLGLKLFDENFWLFFEME